MRLVHRRQGCRDSRGFATLNQYLKNMTTVTFDQTSSSPNASNVVFNLTLRGPAKAAEAIQRLGLVPLFYSLYGVEILLTATGMCLVFMAVVYRMKSKIHVNLQCIFANAELHFVFLAPSRFVTIGLEVAWNGGESSAAVLAVDLAMDIIRTYYIMVASFTLATAALERFFSTAYVHDYETQRRRWLSVSLIVLTNATAAALSVTLEQHIIGMTSPLSIVGTANIGGICLFIWCSRKNTQYYHSGLVNNRRASRFSYCLSERFQVIENIRAIRLLRNLYVSVWVAHAICFCILLVPVLSSNAVLDRVSWQVFNIAIMVFANVVGILNLRQSPHFRARYRRFWSSMRHRRRSAVQSEQECGQIRSVFGAQLIHTGEEQAKLYFVQLERSWSKK